MARQMISDDLSSEFRNFSPRKEGIVEDCKIGEADIVQFEEPMLEDELDDNKIENDFENEIEDEGEGESD